MLMSFVILMSLPLHSLAEAKHIEVSDDTIIIINDEIVLFDDPLYVKDGRIIAPVRDLIKYFAGQIGWDSERREVSVMTQHGDYLAFTIDDVEMTFNGKPYVMDVAPSLVDDKTYIPVRHLAEFLHADVSWDAATNTAYFSSIPLHNVVEGDSLLLLSEQFDTTIELLAERNDLPLTTSDSDEADLVSHEERIVILEQELQVGAMIKVVIPTIMEEKLPLPDPNDVVVESEPHPELELMAKIIMVEAGWESYEGQIAVGSVIMNRINSTTFSYANSVYDVVYAQGQFPPAHNGLLDKSEPNESAWKAAEAVLAGENNVEGALFFYNPKVTSGRAWSSKTLVKEIGNHRFVK